MNDETRAFHLWWANEEDLYRNVIAYAQECLRRVPNMTDQTLGLNVKNLVRVWCEDGKATVIGWAPVKGYGHVRPSVLEGMAKDVGDFSRVDDVEVGEDVREMLGIES